MGGLQQGGIIIGSIVAVVGLAELVLGPARKAALSALLGVVMVIGLVQVRSEPKPE